MIGDGVCNMNMNLLDFFFDGGDCCYENVTKHVTIGDIDIEKPCPDCVCLPSFGYGYCIEDHLGDGKCQDYNNLPQCDFDQGDCCPSKLEDCEHPCKKECVQCKCKTIPHYFSVCYGHWPPDPDGRIDTTCGEHD